MTNTTTTAPATCDSCNSPVGWRTRAISNYRYDGQILALCLDCVDHWHDVTDDDGNLFPLPTLVATSPGGTAWQTGSWSDTRGL